MSDKAWVHESAVQVETTFYKRRTIKETKKRNEKKNKVCSFPPFVTNDSNLPFYAICRQLHNRTGMLGNGDESSGICKHVGGSNWGNRTLRYRST